MVCIDVLLLHRSMFRYSACRQASCSNLTEATDCILHSIVSYVASLPTLALCAAAHIRYWLSAGRGGFGLSGFECIQSSFYCQVYTSPPVDVEQTRYMRVKTSTVPIKAPYFATVKSNNYMPNALALMDAQKDGFDQVTYLTLWRSLHVPASVGKICGSHHCCKGCCQHCWCVFHCACPA